MVNEEEFASLTDAVTAAIEAAVRGLFTSLPAGLTQDSDGHTAAAQSQILGLRRKDDGTMEQKPLPEFNTIPVHFSGGGRMVATHPVKSGDTGILLFMARAIDSWHQSDGQQAPIDARVHHLSDAVFLNGLRADPKKLANVAPDSHQVRSTDGKMTHEVHPDNGATTRVVDPSDGSSDPFNSATTYHETKHSPSSGIVQTATDGTNHHTSTLEKAAGFALSVVKTALANHSMTLSPSGGHNVTVTNPTTGQTSSLTVSPAGISMATPPGGLGLPAGGVSGAALGAGAAAGNVGTLNGDLAGTLPTPTVVGASTLAIYANNAAARAAGVAAGKLYINNSISGTERVVCVAF